MLIHYPVQKFCTMNHSTFNNVLLHESKYLNSLFTSVPVIAGQQDISNEINVTVLFPDSETITPMQGTFANQDEFRKFLFENQNRRVDHAFHSKPSMNRT